MTSRADTALKTLGIVVLSAIVLLGFIRFVEQVHTVATVIIGAIFLTNVIYPAILWLNHRLPLWLSIFIVYVGVIAAVVIALIYVVPALAANVRQAVHDAPAYITHLQLQINNPTNRFFSHLPSNVRLYLTELPANLVGLLSRYSGEVASRAFAVAIAAASIVALFVLIPVVALYIVLDLDHLYAGLLRIIPASSRVRAVKIAVECNAAVGGFIRGQLLVAAIVGALVIALLEILHVPYPILIGIAAGVLEIVPYLGAIVGGAIAVLVALVTNGFSSGIYVLIGFVIINQLEGHVIYPLIVSETVGLSPLIVILALLTGGELFGLPGLIIAIPVAGLIKVLFVNFIPHQEPLELAPTLRRGKRLVAASALKAALAKRQAKRAAEPPKV
ncbi:MAG: AI-2E family transporter [Candidatus Eremiobacteraeota bacterium]|nr:AI-2E family transporter [Candidatus Eremiobacteraeota bacterium]